MRCFLGIGWLAMVMLTGCSDLPEASYPLAPTPGGAVVSPDDGRGAYNWHINKGLFPVRRPFESNIFLPVDAEHVKGLIAQACSNPRVAPFQPPAWVDEQLWLTIDACVFPADTIPSRIVTLADEPSSRQTDSKNLLALNYDGSRLLWIGDTLTFWDTSNGLLLKEIPCPTRQPKVAFLAPTGDTAFVFDAHNGYRISMDGTVISSNEVLAEPIRQAVTSAACDLFIVHSDSELVRYSAELLREHAPSISVSEQASLAVSSEEDLAILDGQEFIRTSLASDSLITPQSLSRQSAAQGMVVAIESDTLALFAHEVFTLSNVQATQTDIARPFVPVCKTHLEIKLAMPTEPGREPWGEWISVCALRPTDGANHSQYLLFDLSLDTEVFSLPSVIDSRRPEQFTLSGNGRVFATANANEPIQVHFRGPRLTKHFEFNALVDRLAELFLEGRAAEGEELIDSLERYARSVPYTCSTRKLLDLQSPVTKRLAAACARAFAYHEKDSPAALEAWLESGSTMAKLLQATNLVSRQISDGSEFSEETTQRLKTLINEVLTANRPPCLALTLLADLMPTLKLQDVSVDAHFVDQFERDPLNDELHLCMTRFFAPEKMGDIGQGAAYLDKVVEFLPAIQRDAFHSWLAFRILQASLPSDQVFAQAMALQVPGYDSGQSTIGLDNDRMMRGLRSLWQQRNSVWAAEFSEACWPEFERVLPPEVVSGLGEIKDAYLKESAFRFSSE